MPENPCREGPPYSGIVIAVHGIGEQSRNSTVRSVVGMTAPAVGNDDDDRMVFHYPLGYFHSDVESVAKVSPFDVTMGINQRLGNVGFSEIFWADIPQSVVQEKRTLEETKQWARSVVARARNLYERVHGGDKSPESKGKGFFDRALPPNFNMAAETLEEVIDTIYVLENLSWILEKAGVMTFDIREILENYLGDVQIVSEFTRYRHQIIGRFHEEISKIHAVDKDADIHIVAHSEGTVIAFMGLLHAMSAVTFQPLAEGCGKVKLDACPSWLKKVKSFMTLGSPIDKHLLLWPKIWTGFDFEGFNQRWKREGITYKIRWKNYYDLADPIGFDLDTARAWLSENNDELFEFTDKDDHGFSRYILPGKAHNDYWEDPQIFEHFVAHVVEGAPVLRKEKTSPEAGKKVASPVPALEIGKDVAGCAQEAEKEAKADSALKPGNQVEAPATRYWASVISSCLPYLLSAVLLTIACYIFLRAAMDFYVPDLEVMERYIRYMMTGLDPRGSDYTGKKVVGDCLAWAGLLGGASISARLPSLSGGKRMGAAAAMLVSFICAFCLSKEILKLMIGDEFGRSSQMMAGTYYWKASLILCLAVALVVWICRWLAQKPSRVRLNDECDLRWYRKGPRPVILFGAILTALIGLSPLLTGGDKKLDKNQLDKFNEDKVIAYRDLLENQRKAKMEAEKKEAEALITAMEALQISSIPSAWKAQDQDLENDAVSKAKEDVDRINGILNRTPPIWPLIVAWVIFIYLWWLSILIFDLAYVWNGYVRSGKAIKCLRNWRDKPEGGPTNSDGTPSTPVPEPAAS